MQYWLRTTNTNFGLVIDRQIKAMHFISFCFYAHEELRTILIH